MHCNSSRYLIVMSYIITLDSCCDVLWCISTCRLVLSDGVCIGGLRFALGFDVVAD